MNQNSGKVERESIKKCICLVWRQTDERLIYKYVESVQPITEGQRKLSNNGNISSNEVWC